MKKSRNYGHGRGSALDRRKRQAAYLKTSVTEICISLYQRFRPPEHCKHSENIINNIFHSMMNDIVHNIMHNMMCNIMHDA